MSDKGKWIKAGTIGVDAGCVWVGDPCYLKNGEGPMQDWQKFCDKLISGDCGCFDTNGFMQFKYEAGHDGICVSSGYGDGEYDVLVRKAGGRVAELRVVFITDEDTDNEDNEEVY